MKGIVFQLRRNLRLPTVRKPKLSLKEYLQKRGVFLFFLLMFLVGLITGAAYSKHADVDLFDRLDFLFSTNLTERAQMSSFEIFATCFGSDFLLTLIVFLMGMSVWGSGAIPLVTVFNVLTLHLR